MGVRVAISARIETSGGSARERLTFEVIGTEPGTP
jgi:hypothetical protein